MTEYTITIGGQAAMTGSTFEVRNPATGKVIASAPECAPDQVDLAMRAARDAQASWQRDAAVRRAAVGALADEVERSCEEFAALITAEQGKPVTESRFEVQDAVGDLRYFAGLQMQDEVIGAGARAVQVLRGPVGPLCNRPQFDRVSELVADAPRSGARIAAGGKAMPGQRYFFEPTILTGLGEDARIVVEEQFGPALPVLPYRQIEAAIHAANSTHFGLRASVWTGDSQHGPAIATDLESGTVWVNTHQDAVLGQPFGGLKWSGTGVEGGPCGLHAFTDLQVVHVRHDA